MQRNRNVTQPPVTDLGPFVFSTAFPAPAGPDEVLEGSVHKALDLAGIGFAVLRCDASTVTMNAACRRMLACATRGLRWSGGVLHARRRKSALALEQALADAVHGPAQAVRVEDVTGPGAIELLASGVTPSRAGRPRIAVIMRAPVDAAPDEDLLAQLYDLTPAEAGLAGALLGGNGLARACAVRGITLNTGKGYLKRIFEKTGTRRQGELVAMVMRGVAPLMNA